MPTHAAERERGTTRAAKGAAEHASAIARLEVRLALAELKEKLAEAGVGAGLLAGAALVAFFGTAFALATVAAGLSTAIPVWAVLLIMTGLLFAVTAALLALGARALRRGMPPTPEQAIREAKLTAQALTSNGDQRGR